MTYDIPESLRESKIKDELYRKSLAREKRELNFIMAFGLLTVGYFVAHFIGYLLFFR